MHNWRRLPLHLLALLALVATMLPQTLWACPMNGRVDTASRTCQGLMPRVGGEMPCAGSGSKCCKPLQVPVSSSDNSPSNPAFTALHHAVTIFDFAPLTLEDVPFALSAFQAPQATVVRVYLAHLSNSPPPLWTQFRSPSLSGRAPPVH